MTTGIITNAATLLGPYWNKTALRYQFYSALPAVYIGKNPTEDTAITYDNGATFGEFTTQEKTILLVFFSIFRS